MGTNKDMTLKNSLGLLNSVLLPKSGETVSPGVWDFSLIALAAAGLQLLLLLRRLPNV